MGKKFSETGVGGVVQSIPFIGGAATAIGNLIAPGNGNSFRRFTWEADYLRQMQTQQGQDMGEYNYGLNERAAENAQRRQVENFNMENAYNTPLAQRRRLEAAGMNPGLLYGMGGGTTGTGGVSTAPQGAGGTGVQGGVYGSASNYASSTSAIASKQMAAAQTIQVGLQLEKLKSEVDVNESIAEANRATAEVKSGVETDKLKAETDNIKEVTERTRAEREGRIIANEINKLDLLVSKTTVESKIETIENDAEESFYRLKLMSEDLVRKARENTITRETMEDTIKGVKASVAATIADIASKYAGVALTNRQISAIGQNIDIALTGKEIDLQRLQLDVTKHFDQLSENEQQRMMSLIQSLMGVVGNVGLGGMINQAGKTVAKGYSDRGQEVTDTYRTPNPGGGYSETRTTTRTGRRKY